MGVVNQLLFTSMAWLMVAPPMGELCAFVLVVSALLFFLKFLPIRLLLSARRLAAVGPVVLTREEALAIALAEARARGYPWEEPVRIHEEWLHYFVLTNAEYRGGSVHAWINALTGAASMRFLAR